MVKTKSLNGAHIKSFAQAFSKACGSKAEPSSLMVCLQTIAQMRETPPAFRRSRAWVPASKAPIQNHIAKRYLIHFHDS